MSSTVNANPAADTTAWHAMTVDAVVKRLTTDTGKGLDAAEAANRLQKYGPNRLPEGKKRGPFMRFLSQFNNVLVYVLLGCRLHQADAQPVGRCGDHLRRGRPQRAPRLHSGGQGREGAGVRSATCCPPRHGPLRDGETRMIPAEELVPGDIVLLESGDKIPADLRLVDAKNLRTEEAALTGESVPADKNTDPVSANATVGDRECMAFSGTMVVSGRATGVVVATGSETELGRINAAARRRERARDAAPAPDQEVRLRHHRRHRRRWRSGVRLRQVGEGHGFRGAVPGGGRHRGVGDSGRPAGDHHDHARDRRAAHGAAQRHHPAAAGGGDARARYRASAPTRPARSPSWK